MRGEAPGPRPPGVLQAPLSRAFLTPTPAASLQCSSGREELLRDPDPSLVSAVPASAGDPCSVEEEASEEGEL